MNSYFFFGFHIFKDFTVTFMCQVHSKTSLNLITELVLNFLINQKNIEKFLLEIFFQFYLFKVFLITRNSYFCLISGR
jgi:hypothetical protein